MRTSECLTLNFCFFQLKEVRRLPEVYVTKLGPEIYATGQIIVILWKWSRSILILVSSALQLLSNIESFSKGL